MIDLQKIIAECDFHIKRGDTMVMPPKLLKELAERLLDEDEEFEQVQTDRDFEAEQVAAAKALQAAPDVRELIEALNWCVYEINRGSPAVINARAVLAKHGGSNG